MNSSAPKVSIVVPVYNVEQYLRECLDSLMHQTLQDIEILCVNDGSTDSSPKILEEYARNDARFKIISKPNSGYGHTMNVGMDAAYGEYIGIVESDDYVPRNMYQTLYGIAIKNDLDLIKADFYRFYTNDGEVTRVLNPLTTEKQYYNRIIDPFDEPIVFRFAMNTWSGIYKRDFLRKFGIRHNETPGASFQDNGFWFQTLCYAKRAYFLNRPFYMNRRDNVSSSVHDRGKVYAMCDEYAFIRNILEKDPERKGRFIAMYWFKKFHNYEFTYKRIGDEYKDEFLEKFRDEFQYGFERGELDPSIFSEMEWGRIEMLLNSTEKYRTGAEIAILKNEISALKDELSAVKGSVSYRIGRKITAAPRKLRNIFRDRK